MTNTIYTTTGCARCKITKGYLQEKAIDYEEYDFKSDGKEAFSKFYRAHRADIYRGKDGVEFPVFTDGKIIRQGVSMIIGYLIAGKALDGFFGRSLLHGEWIDGLDVSNGDPAHSNAFLQVLAHLKRNGLKIQIAADGRNAALLEAVIEKSLADRIILDVPGPAALYELITGTAIDEEDLNRSITLSAGFSDYRFQTTVASIIRPNGTVDYLTPEEVGETARMIEAATGSKRHPYELHAFDPQGSADEALRSIEPLPAGALFKHRSAARRYLVMTEIAK